MNTLYDLVIDQVVAGGPQICDDAARERYVAEEINAWTNIELLERISDALRLKV